MDITQLIILVSLSLVTITIVSCGIWLMLVLKEVRQTIIKTNGILDDTRLVSSTVAQPFTSISEFIEGFKNGINLFNSLFKKKHV